MDPDWLLLVCALSALMVPLPAFYSRQNSFRALAELDIERRNGSWWRTWRRVLRFPGHWIELVRGLLAAWAVLETVDQLATVSELYRTHATWGRFVVPLAAALISVVLIAVLFRSPGKSQAPVFFVSAALLMVVPLTVGIPSVLFALASAFAFKALAAYFAGLALTLMLLGLLLDRLIWPSLAGALLAVAPLLLAAGQHHELVIPIRRNRQS